MNEGRVVLVSMPFHGLDAPSLGLSLLKADLAREGIPCTIRYLTLDFAGQIGVDSYSWIADDSLGTFLGEWIFAHCLSPEMADRADEYVERFLSSSVQISASRLKQVLAIRAQARPFLDAAARDFDWSPYDVIGFTSTFQQNTASLALAKMLKIAHPRTPIVFGGGNCADEMGLQLHRSFPWVDHVCLGEGDGVFTQLVLQLLGRRPVRPLPGIVRRSGGESRAPEQPAAPVQRLDALPIPDFDDYFEQLESSPARSGVHPYLPLETSRGCWWGVKNHCTFCGLDRASIGFRSKTQSRALSEIRAVAARYTRRLGASPRVVFMDNILDLSYFHELLPALRDSGLNLTFFYETKTNLTKHQVQLLAEAGVTEIQPGIESLSTALLGLMKKGCTALQNLQLLKWCDEFGLGVGWNMLYGVPGEDVKEYARQCDVIGRVHHLQPPRNFGPIRLDRFSPYFVRAGDYGLTNVRPAKPLHYVYPVPPEDLHRLAYHFEFDDPDAGDPALHVAGLAQSLGRWRKVHREEFLYGLSRNGRLLIWDGRHGSAPSSMVLEGERKALYEFCDAVRAFRSIGAHMRAAWGLPEDATRRLLDEFVASGLMAADEGHYLSLAVGLRARRARAGRGGDAQTGTAPAGQGVPDDRRIDRLPRGTIRPRATVRSAEIGDEVVLLNPAARRVCLLNPVAAAIWDLIDEGQTLDAIVRLLVAAVPANAGRVRADVRAAVRTFLDNGMVDIAERPSVRPRRPA